MDDEDFVVGSDTGLHDDQDDDDKDVQVHSLQRGEDVKGRNFIIANYTGRPTVHN